MTVIALSKETTMPASNISVTLGRMTQRSPRNTRCRPAGPRSSAPRSLTAIVTLTEGTSSKDCAWNPSLTAQRMENQIVRLLGTKVRGPP